MSTALFRKMYRDHWKSLISWGLVIVFMVTIELMVYPSIVKSGEAAKTFIDSYPDAFKKMFRMEDYTSGAGFLNTELFSMMIPLVMLGVGVTWGASAIAEEEESGTADLLFVLPVRRRTVLLSRMAATTVALALLAVVTFVNIVLLRGHFGLEVNTQNLAWACLTHLFLGTTFSGIGFLLAALTGRKGLSLGVASGLGIISFLFFSLAPLVSNFEYTNAINPFQWAIAHNTLNEGLNLLGVVRLIVTSLVFFFSSLMIFERREIHS